MAISPQKEQLNSELVTPVVRQGSDVAGLAAGSAAAGSAAAGSAVTGDDSIEQLLAEVKAKVEAQLVIKEPAVKTQGHAVFNSATFNSATLNSATLNADKSSRDDLVVDDLSVDIPDSTQTQRSEPPSLSIQSEPPTFATLDVQQMAAEGYFQAIAYWLNEVLVPHNVYAKVLEDEVAGRIKVLVEFERAPKQKRLIRFVCDRLYRLNSNVIEGAHIIVRPIGEAKIAWEKSVRIPTAAQREQLQMQKRQAKGKQATVPQGLDAETNQPIQLEAPAGSNRQGKSAVLQQPAQVAKAMVRRRFTFFRAAFVCGSAFAAFVFGGFFEMLWSERLIGPAASQPSEAIAPWYGETNEPDVFHAATGPLSMRSRSTRDSLIPQATAISFRPASRFPGRTVEAAFETVAVIPHRNVVNPSDPTVTLMFGGELALNDFTFKDTTDLDNLFSDIDIYRKADVAMMGLAEPLAYASTSLQEDFYQRTRPQAVEALKSGGIDIVGLASDGSMVHGSRGLSETLSNLDRQGIYRVGAGRNQQEAHRPEILEVKGQRIAYLGYSSDALKGARKEKAGVALSQTEERSHVKEDIQAIRHHVDWVVVSYRWGEGDEAQAASETNADADSSNRASLAKAPADWQKTLAREAVDAGADLVVGSHPHQIQGIEVYRDRPIAYSLGDFAFSRDPQTDSLSARDTAALKISLRNQRMKVEFLPVTLTNAKLQRASGEQGAALLQSIRSASKALEHPLQFPAVLTPEPPAVKTDSWQSAPTPIAAEDEPFEPDAIAVPESPNAMPGVIEVIQTAPAQTAPAQTAPAQTAPAQTAPAQTAPTQTELIQPGPIQPKTADSENTTAPALDPMMRESEALFMPKEDLLEENSRESDDMQENELLREELRENLLIQDNSDVEATERSAARQGQQPSEQPLEQQLDAQWQNESWQQNLQEAQEAWEDPTSNAVPTSILPEEENAWPKVDLAKETLPAETEMFFWQDPFAEEDSSWADLNSTDAELTDAELTDADSEIPNAASSNSENFNLEDSELEENSIRPYAEPIIGPLSSSMLTPSTSGI